jgi:hypothetical protein
VGTCAQRVAESKLNYIKETVMNTVDINEVDNLVVVKGTIKNIKVVSSTTRDGQNFIKGNLSRRNSDGKCVWTTPIVAFDEDVKKMLLELPTDESGITQVIKVIAEGNTRFDTRQGVDNSQRRAPWNQIVIKSLVL